MEEIGKNGCKGWGRDRLNVGRELGCAVCCWVGQEARQAGKGKTGKRREKGRAVRAAQLVALFAAWALWVLSGSDAIAALETEPNCSTALLPPGLKHPT